MTDSTLTTKTEVQPANQPARICVVGLGYVGLPLAVAFDEEGQTVTGYDIDTEKVGTLADGTDTTGDLGDAAVADSDVRFTSDAAAIADSDYVIVTVPTPVDDMGNPNLDFIDAAGRTVGEHMERGTTVVLESTVYPGATGDVLVPALEETSGLTAGEEFYVGYSPERASPGDAGRGVREVKKIVSGQTEEVAEDLAELYGTVVEAGVYQAPTIETAEAAKAIENVQRDINIALANELSIACEYMDLDTHEVLAAAGTKWNFHEYRPGLVGGHCIPVDPLFFAHRSEREGFSPKLVLQGREINEYMPKHTGELVLKGLNGCGKVLQESRVLVLGLSYKPNVGDIRTSEIRGVINELETYGVECVGHDPHAEETAMRESFDIDIQESPDPAGFDGVILATGHDAFESLDLDAMAAALNDDPFLMDVPGFFEEAAATEAGFAYDRL